MKNKKTGITFITLSIIVLVALNLGLVYAEKNADGASIKSFGGALWYMVITMTTVGYGDMYPVTEIGKIIGYVYVFGSLGVLGYLISNLSSKYQQYMEEKKLGYKGTSFEGHTLLIGWNAFSKMVAEEIYHSSRKIAIVTDSKDDIDLIYHQFDQDRVFALFADFQNLDALQKVNVEKANTVLISLGDDTLSLQYVIDFHARYKGPDIVVSIDKAGLKNTFMAAGARYVIAHNEIASRLVASYMFEPDVAELNNDLLQSARTEDDLDMLEYRVTPQNPFLKKAYLDVFVDLKQEKDAVLVALSRKTDGQYKTMTNPGSGLQIQEEDYLIILCTGKVKKSLEQYFGVAEGR